MQIETIVLYSLLFGFGLACLFVINKLLGEVVYKKKYRTAITTISNLNRKIKELSQNIAPANPGLPSTLDYKDMSLDQVAEALGIEPGDLNNPLIRPFAEKMFNRLKQGNVKNEQQEETGY